MEKKKLLLLTDTPVIKTGLGRICKELANRFLVNYDVAVAGWHHTPFRYNLNYHVYPVKKGGDDSNQLIAILDNFNPDILLAIGDIWDFLSLAHTQYQYRDKKDDFKSLLWVTVDGEWSSYNMWSETIRSFDEVISFSKFGIKELSKCSTSKFKYIYPGIDHKTFHPYESGYKWGKGIVDPKKTFICIMVGQNHDRKNIPGTIEAFADFAKNKDDVFLFLATDPHAPWGHDIFSIIKNLNIENKSAVIKNVTPKTGISDERLNLLYNMATVIINSSIGEGLGLPLLEAQAAGCVPISTNYAAGAEIVDDRGKLIDIVAKVYGEYDIKRAIISHQHLIDILNELYSDWKNEKVKINEFKKSGVEFVKKMTWDNTAFQLNDVIKNITDIKRTWVKEKVHIQNLKMLQIIPSWGKNCGIAEYTKELGQSCENAGENVTIFPGNNTKEILELTQENKFNVAVFQHEYSFWPDRFVFKQLLESLKKKKIKTVIEFHSYAPLIAYNDIILETVDEVIVHCEIFKNKFKGHRNYNHIHVIPLACNKKVDLDCTIMKQNLGIINASPIIGSFGFLRDQKGYHEVLRAASELIGEYPNLKVLLICPTHEFGSPAYVKQFLKYIEDIHMDERTILIREYMNEEKLLETLSCTDLFVLNYKESPAGGSNSAAVKTLMRIQKPIIVSDTIYFADMNYEVYKIPNMNIASIKEAIKKIWNNKAFAQRFVQNANIFTEQNSWKSIAKKHLEVYR